MNTARTLWPMALAAAASACFACQATAQESEAFAPGASCHKPHPAGTAVYAVRGASVDREFVLVVPQRYDGVTRLPVVLAFHGSGSGPEQQLALSGLTAAAEERGLLVLAPQAARPWPTGGYTWNVPPEPEHSDDVELVATLLDEAGEHVCVDTRRVYASGFSGGARLSSELGCALADRIAAIAAVGGLRHPRECSPSRAVPIIAFHGTADPINPYAGGGPQYWGEGVEDALRGWAVRRVAPPSVQESISETVTRISYATREDDADLVLYRLEGAGHVWPGTDLDLPVERLGPMSDEIDATRVMLDFFQRHALP